MMDNGQSLDFEQFLVNPLCVELIGIKYVIIYQSIRIYQSSFVHKQFSVRWILAFLADTVVGIKAFVLKLDSKCNYFASSCLLQSNDMFHLLSQSFD